MMDINQLEQLTGRITGAISKLHNAGRSVPDDVQTRLDQVSRLLEQGNTALIEGVRCNDAESANNAAGVIFNEALQLVSELCSHAGIAM